MPYYPIQSSFSAGEISPRVFAQEDSPVYAKGVELLRNFIALSQGPAKRRAAFRFIADLADVGAIDVNLGARVIPFDLSEQLTFILVLTPLRMDIYNLNGPAVDNNLVKDGDFFEELDAWLVLFTGAGRVLYNPEQRGAELDATALPGSTALIEQPMTVLTTGDHTFSGRFINQVPGSGALCRGML
ncbi:MAG: hypothetical protein IIB19_00375, partial [Chloroflexi bacterium]|nr:hypothetical protein [Chloroflexota bacterium]